MLGKWVKWGFVCLFLCFLAKWDMLKEYRVSICILKENFQKERFWAPSLFQGFFAAGCYFWLLFLLLPLLFF